MSIDEINKIIERSKKATKGPWVSYIEGRDHTSGCSFIKTAGADIELTGATNEDQDFIAASRQDIPNLIDEILRLRRIIDENGIEY